MVLLSDFPPEIIEKSFESLQSSGIIYNYESLDGGYRVWLGEKVNPVDMSLSEARGFTMGAEIVDYRFRNAIKNPEFLEKLLFKMLGF